MRNPLTTAILAALIGVTGVVPAAHSAGANTEPLANFEKTALAPKDAFAHRQAGVRLIEDYGSFALYRIDTRIVALSPDMQIQHDADVLEFAAYPFDTQRGNLRVPAPFSAQAAGAGLQVVQFVGPVKQAWLDALTARGIRPVQYVANNGYIVWTDGAAQAGLDTLRRDASWLQFSAPLHDFLKVDPQLAELVVGPKAGTEVDVVVQIYRHPGDAGTRAFVESKGLPAVNQLGPSGIAAPTPTWAPILAFANRRLRVRASDIPALAARPDVMFVGAYQTPTMLDEKQGIILSGNFAPVPATPSYLQFLLDRGFSQNPAEYPIVDVTDSTINEGGTGGVNGTVVNTADRMLHVQGNIIKPSRVAYFKNCSAAPSEFVGDIDGHGTLNGGIIADYDQRSGYPFQDGDGHRLGLGINPFGRIGSTAIFIPFFNIDRCAGNDQGVILSNWQSGARISSNSWGTNSGSVYTASAQIYDAGVRDADPGNSGNQELIYLFAAGNAGPGASTIGAPGSAKNVITVGASENLRPFVEPPTSQCGPTAASNPQNVVDFSSRGPAQGNRSKPEVLAPGTHIQAGASNFVDYDGSAVCTPFFPESPPQQIFTYSSGTSHSTPAVAGVASLAYWWIQHGGAGSAAGSVSQVGGNRAPSPAMMKAWLIAHPSYLQGTGANDNLPSFAQGYGMPNTQEMFNETPKFLVDQTEVFGNSGETRSYTLGISDISKPVRITMAYTDAPGALASGSLVNDLDLTVEANGTTYRGNSFNRQWSAVGGTADRKNNYEAVFLPSGTTGDLTITLSAINVAGDGLPNSGDLTDQDFALVCSNCVLTPTYTLVTPQRSANVCIGDDYRADVTIGSIANFATPVDLILSGAPGGTLQAVTPPRVTPPGATTVSIRSSSHVAAGRYPLVLTGTSPPLTKHLELDLTYAASAPPAPVLTTPGNGATNVGLQPVLSWEAAREAGSYLVEVSSDRGFSNIVAAAEVIDTVWTVPASLNSSTRYYWRVTAKNGCGDSPDSLFSDSFEGGTASPPMSVFAFSTEALPGDCPLGSTPQVLFNDDIESGAPGWLRGGDANGLRWRIGSPAHSGMQALRADNAEFIAFTQALVSPPVTLPAGLSPITLSFWNQQSLQFVNSLVCFDGGVLDISTDGGVQWTQITTGLLTDPYDGVVSSTYSNQLAGRPAWCGNPQAYLNSIVDLTPYAGNTVRFRFFMANGTRNDITGPPPPNPGWAIDDVKVLGCSAN